MPAAPTSYPLVKKKHSNYWWTPKSQANHENESLLISPAIQCSVHIINDAGAEIFPSSPLMGHIHSIYIIFQCPSRNMYVLHNHLEVQLLNNK